MITVGIPRSLLYYKYNNLWSVFFNELGIKTILSNKTNKKILEEGCKIAQDEACLALKIYLGHVNELINKVDYILIPRIASIKKKEKLCTNFLLLYDLINNSFNTKIIHYNIDIDNNLSEENEFINMGISLGKSKKQSKLAYQRAKYKEKELNNIALQQQNAKLFDNKTKVLLVGHPYNLYDELIGKPIVKFLNDNDIATILSDIYDKKIIEQESKQISSCIYWTYNKELMGSISHYKDYIDGIIIITTFPCGPDSLCNEMITNKIKDIPIITIVIDELNNNSGIITRLESFIDIINMKNGVKNG